MTDHKDVVDGLRRSLLAEDAILFFKVSDLLKKLAADADRNMMLATEAVTRADKATAALAAAEARAAELVGLLEPFADVSGEGDEDFPDDTPVTITFGRSTVYSIKLGDFRRASAAAHQALQEVQK